MSVTALVVCVLAAAASLSAAQLSVDVTDHENTEGLVTLEVNGTRNIQLVESNSYTIGCNAPEGGFQQSEVWFRDGSAVTTDGSQDVYVSSDGNNRINLVLNDFASISIGSYNCRSQDEQLTLIITTGNPVAIASTPVLSLVSGSQGSSFQALISFVSGSPQPLPENITWTFNGIPSTTMGSIFTLGNFINSGQAGTYVCTVQTMAGIVSTEFVVTVSVQPEVTLSPVSLSAVTEGRTFSLTCNDIAGTPPPVFSWERDNQPVTVDGSRVSLRSLSESVGSTLTITDVRRSDAGEYSCTGRNSAGSSTQSITVEVLYAPVLTPNTTRFTWVTEETLVLHANLIGANPTTINSVVWTKDGAQTRGIPSQQGPRFTLTIPMLLLSDEGVYELALTNQIGAGVVQFNITIDSPPVLTATPAIVYARNKAINVTLTLTVTDAKPPVNETQITWSFVPSDGGAPVIIDTSQGSYSTVLAGEELQLIIDGPTMEEGGVYNVSILHRTGVVTASITLIVLDPPAPPTRITAVPVTDSPCLTRVQWTTPSDNITTIAPTDYTIIEVTVNNGSTWVELVRAAGDEEVVRIPGVGLNTQYQLRGRGSNNIMGIGEGNNFTLSPEVLTAYPPDNLPRIALRGSPVSQTEINLSWELPVSDCYTYSRYELSCSLGNVVSVGGEATSGSVGGLLADTLYNCTLNSTVEDLDGEFSHPIIATTRAFTFPEPPPQPPQPSVNVSTTVTITVNFDLGENHADISHYQVIVLRLTSSSIPAESPDVMFGRGYQFATHATAHSSDPERPYIAAEVAAATFNPVFTLGGGQITMGSNTTYTNGELSPGMYYTCFLRAFPKTFYDRAFQRKREARFDLRQYEVFSSSNFLPAQQTVSTESSLLPLVVGVCVGGLLVVLVLIILACVGICCLRARRMKQVKLTHKAQVDDSVSDLGDGTPDYIPTPDLGRKTKGIELKQINVINPMSNGVMFEPSGPVKEENFADHVEKFDANRQLLFQEEFEWLQTNSPWHPAEASNHPLNDEKNRYHNITAFDHTRVKLSAEAGVECSDYINANYIQGYSGENEYIAAQGPLEQTVVEFWKMVWEQNTATIVMLTNLVELGKRKCTQYWPVNGTVIYGGVKVTLDNTVELPAYTIRNLVVSSLMSNDSRMVLQFQFTCWPDYGVPKLAAPLLNFLKAVNTSNPPGVGPIVIHCSAGVGRSGTVIAIDYCLKQLQHDGFMDPCGFVQKMRNQRNYMVQTDQQYGFLHFALLESITYGDTSFDLSAFSDSYQGLQEVNPASGLTLLEEEFRRIGTVKTMIKRSSFQQKIRNKGAPPRHFNSSFMGGVTNPASLEVYSAHYMDTYRESRRLIIVDGPNKDSVGRWWQMVWDEDVMFVVNLTPQDTESFRYWPESGSEQYGSIVVEVEDTKAEHLYTRRKIKLSNAKVDGISHMVEQYQFIGWTTQFVPRVPDFVGFVCDVMNAMESLTKNQRVLLHDIDSIGPSGVMCSLYYCIERLRVERIVDVFQAVQMMRLQRPGSVKTIREYAFVYDCVFEFIRTHSNKESQL